MLKKTIVFAMVLAMMLALLSACSAPAGTPSDGGAGAPPPDSENPQPESEGTPAPAPGGAEPTVIQYYHWTSEQQPLYDELVPLFESQNPDIKIESTVVPYSDYWTLLQTAIPSGNGPDAFLMSTSRYNIYRDAGGLLENLSPYMQQDGVTLSDLNESILEMYNSDGNVYGIAKDCDSLGLFYNKKIFDELGEAYPDGTWTYDDCFAFSKRVSKADENFWGFLIQTADDLGFVPYLRSYGGYYINEDRVTPQANLPIIIERMEMWRQGIQEGYLVPVAVMDEMETDQLFMNGQVAMVIDGPWNIQPYLEAFEEGTLDVTDVPRGSDHRDVTSGSTCISVAATSNKKDLAWRFASFFATDPALEIIAKYNLSPYKSYADNWAESFPGINAAVFPAGVVDARDPVEADDRTLVEPFEEAVSRVLTTDEPVADILNDIQAQMEVIAARQN